MRMNGRIVHFVLVVLMVGTVASADRKWRDRSWTRRLAVTEKFYRSNIKAMQALLSLPQMPERYLTGNESFSTNLKVKNRVLGFSWSNCGSDSDPVQIHSLSVNPDPIQIPGDLQLSFEIATAVNITAPFQVDLDVKKKVSFWWVDVPCVDQAGSCTYQDICALLPGTCPPDFIKYNIPCSCPVPQGTYTLPDSDINIPQLHVPSWLSTGDYKVQVDGKAPDGSSLFCWNLELSLD